MQDRSDPCSGFSDEVAPTSHSDLLDSVLQDDIGLLWSEERDLSFEDRLQALSLAPTPRAALFLRGGESAAGNAVRGMGCCKMQSNTAEKGAEQFKRNMFVGVLGLLQLLPRGTGQRILNSPGTGE